MPPLSGHARRFLIFAAVGAVGTAAHYVVLVALVQGAGADAVAASTAGFLAGMVVNYTLNRAITFRSTKPHREAAAKFLAVAGVGLVLNALLMALLVDRLGLPYLAGQVIATGALLFWHYLGSALWTFRVRQPG